MLLALADLGKRRKQFKRLNEISNSAIHEYLDEIFYCVLHKVMHDPESKYALYFNMTKNIACVITPLKRILYLHELKPPWNNNIMT